MERGGEIVRFCRVFSFLSLIFLCNGAGLKRRDTESEELLTCQHHGEERRKSTLPHVPLLPCLPLGPSQCVLGRCAPRLGYRARMSRLMDTKQRCPWWWRELGKLESIPAFFNTHTPHPPVSYNSFSQSLPVWLSLCLSVFSVCVEDEAREGAVLVVVASMGFASVQFDVNLVPCVQMEDDAVGGVVVVLVSVLGNGAGTNLQEQGQTNT